ncbi:hypothetical protein [Dyadobacter sp. CY326]|uniref:hypothetical protein n=1 Tax=Dyadobacter sp. CY326 TaxID=2907300 RepID=UPI001F481325|nr:hypothetical protein [Dyadobacter sp. CY326]MCE7065170.1 hypothetical protein [Dyadobacter sp. CY326]
MPVFTSFIAARVKLLEQGMIPIQKSGRLPKNYMWRSFEYAAQQGGTRKKSLKFLPDQANELNVGALAAAIHCPRNQSFPKMALILAPRSMFSKPRYFSVRMLWVRFSLPYLALRLMRRLSDIEVITLIFLLTSKLFW